MSKMENTDKVRPGKVKSAGETLKVAVVIFLLLGVLIGSVALSVPIFITLILGVMLIGVIALLLFDVGNDLIKSGTQEESDE
jgi:uncharacterized transporter YbjL